MLRTEQLVSIVDTVVALGHELPGVELKGPGPATNGRLMAQVAKAVLGLANKRDGGVVLVGLQQGRQGICITGLTPEDAATWVFDDVADRLAPYADPHVDFELYGFEAHSVRLVALEVSEFADMPILCGRDFAEVLERGALYVRSRMKPETTRRLTSAELRDLLERAVDKEVRRTMRRLGIVGPPGEVTPSGEERFAAELEGLL